MSAAPGGIEIDEIPSASRAGFVALEDLSDDQKEVYDAVLTWYEQRPWERDRSQLVFKLGGYAGTGKTSLCALLLEHLTKVRRKAVAVITPTGKASVVLSRKLGPLAGLPAFLGTIHSFMYIPIVDDKERLKGWARRFFEKIGEGEHATYVAKNGLHGGKVKIPKIDLILVDESSMLNRDLEKDIEAFGVPVLAVGDHGQLPPVTGANTWMKSLSARLERIHRQAEDNPILALATYVRETRRLPPSHAMRSIGIPFYDSLKEASAHVIETHRVSGISNTALITYTNSTRCELNANIHQHRHGSLKPVRGSQVICLKNDKDRNLINGMRGVIASDPEPYGHEDFQLKAEVEFEGDELFIGPFVKAQFGLPRVMQDIDEATKLTGITVSSMKNLGAFFDFGYVLTCHKAQGSEFSDVFVVLQKGLTPRDADKWLYTAITRASQRLSFIETW